MATKAEQRDAFEEMNQRFGEAFDKIRPITQKNIAGFNNSLEPLRQVAGRIERRIQLYIEEVQHGN